MAFDGNTHHTAAFVTHCNTLQHTLQRATQSHMAFDGNTHHTLLQGALIIDYLEISEGNSHTLCQGNSPTLSGSLKL